MCTTQFDLFTYNCHLFASLPKIPGIPDSALDDIVSYFSTDSLFADKHRAVALRQFLQTKQYSTTNPVIPLVALQEVWDAAFVDDGDDSIPEHVDNHHGGTLNNRYRLHTDEDRLAYVGAKDLFYTADPDIFVPELQFLNPNGLILLADTICQFDNSDGVRFNYINACTQGGDFKDSWASQDRPVAKGFMRTACSWPCTTNPGAVHTVGLYTTHMPTSYGSYSAAVGCCFDTLAADIVNWQNGTSHSGASRRPSAVFVLGDLNIDIFDDSTLYPATGKNQEYTDVVVKRLLNAANLRDLAAGSPQHDSLVTVSNQNTLWQRFNGTGNTASQRIDYILCADSVDGTMQVSLATLPNAPQPAIDVVHSSALTVSESGQTYDCSDHYPLEAIVTVTVPDSVCRQLPTR
jgi:hypothetical protein